MLWRTDDNTYWITNVLYGDFKDDFFGSGGSFAAVVDTAQWRLIDLFICVFLLISRLCLTL